MPPENVDNTTLVPKLAFPPTQMPLPPAEIVPELAMPPKKVEALTAMAVARLAEIEPLLMPPAPTVPNTSRR